MSTPTPAQPSVSPIQAAQQAIELTRRRLFPFRFERWLALGFVAFLDQCGRSGSPSGLGYTPGHVGDGGGTAGGGLPGLPPWLGQNLGSVVATAAVVLAFVVALVALVLWLNSRGVFMYLDDVASGRSDVARPWREHKELAASFFAWRFGIAAATLAGVLILAGFGGLIYFMVRRGQMVAGVALALVLAGLVPLFLLLLLVSTLLSLALRDFVAPIQLSRGTGCGEGILAFWELLKARPGPFALYVLLKLAFSIGLALVALALGCGSCCLGFLPVVAQTALQPALYFERAWSLYLLRPMGIDVLREAGPAPSGTPSLPPSAPSWPPSSGPSEPPPSSQEPSAP